MINLNALNKQTVKIDVEGQELVCHKASQTLLMEIIEMQKLQPADMIKNLYSILTKVFNNNVEGDKYKQGDLEKFIPLELGMNIISQYLGMNVEDLGK